MTRVNQELTTKFYTDGSLTIKVKPGQEIPDGFYPGRTFNAKPWNKGLTKETDERVKNNGEKTKQARLTNNSYENPWNKGSTKETDERVKQVADKVSQVRNSKFWATTKGRAKSEEEKLKQSTAMQGKPAWNKGLHKESDARVQKIANALNGHPCFVTDWTKAKEKEYLTKKLHNSFNTSKPEKALLKNLQTIYGESDVETQYCDTRYKNPITGYKFKCDFYIKSLDLFIELNYTWYHGTHPFDPNNKEDQKQLSNWVEKANTLSSSYDWAIKTWTEIDPLKLDVLRKNKLNFMIIYPRGLVIDK